LVRTTPEPPKRSRRVPVLIGLLFLVAVAAGVWYLRKPPAQPQVPVAQVRTAAVVRGTVERSIRINGVTSARNYANIIAPRLRGPGGDRELNILNLAPSGKFVKKGDLVAELDPQALRDRIDDQAADVLQAQNDVAKRKVEQELDMENLQQTLRVAKSDLDKAQLDLKTLEIRIDLDRELLQLAVEEADARYKQLLQDVDSKRTSHRADLRMLEISLQIQQMRLEQYQNDINKYNIHAPMDGMIVMQTLNRQGGDQAQIQVGDRVSPGQPFMKIVDPASMQVEAAVNQSESSLFRIGQQARVGLDAFPGAQYGGKLDSIGALASAQGRQQFFIRSIPIRVDLEGLDAKVIPDLSASADILLEKAENVLITPASAVRKEGNETVVYVRSGETFARRTVELGTSDGVKVAVLSGLNEGDQVRLN
jgi:multidrug efflux pump subunit AcrA (membrane-fusion protein)